MPMNNVLANGWRIAPFRLSEFYRTDNSDTGKEELGTI